MTTLDFSKPNLVILTSSESSLRFTPKSVMNDTRKINVEIVDEVRYPYNKGVRKYASQENFEKPDHTA